MNYPEGGGLYRQRYHNQATCFGIVYCMKYDKKPIPTEYNGIQFRSKLEAQWAVFFGMVEWEWFYEPYEINGRLPDFIINCGKTNYNITQIIVEVKPKIFSTDEWRKEIIESYKDFPAHILFLTEQPFYNYYDQCAIGYGYQYGQEEWFDDTFVMKCNDDFSSYLNMWDGMVYGKVERKNFIEFDDYDCRNLKWLFNNAASVIQFDSYSR